MKPVKVKTVQVRAGGPSKLGPAGSPHLTPPSSGALATLRAEPSEPSGSVVASIESQPARKAQADRPDLPPQPANHGTGNGVLGVLPASSLSAQAMAYADPSYHLQQPTAAPNSAVKPLAAHSGWIIQVGALESEGEARQRIDAARSQARGLLANADPFTEPVVSKGDHKLFRARFAGLDRGQAENVCRTLRRSDISCITVKN
jgi:D-alanyl-D-alanine carboxypeptidase